MQIGIQEERTDRPGFLEAYGVFNANTASEAESTEDIFFADAEISFNTDAKYSAEKSESYDVRHNTGGANSGVPAEISEVSDKADIISGSLEKLNEILDNDVYSRMETLGLAPEEDSPDTLVTVAERIKIELAAYCDDYKHAGQGIPVNGEKVKQVLGANAALESDVSECADEGNDISLTDGAKEYIIRNNLSLTEENIHKAIYSSKNTYSRGKVPNEQWAELEPQAKKVIEKNGMEATDDMIDNSRWLIEHNLPVTGDNLKLLDKLNNFSGNADVSAEDDREMRQQAEDAVNTVKNVTLDELKYLAVNNNELTIKGLKEAADYRKNHEFMFEQPEPEDSEIELKTISSVRIITEARLIMTTRSTYTMIKAGVNIETQKLSGLLDRILEDEKSYYMKLCRRKGIELTGEEQSVYINAMNSITYVRASSSTVIAQGVNAIYQGTAKANIATFSSITMQSVTMAYETGGTVVRKDLGDSIKKAFSSIDPLLENLGMELTENNRRAVRILSYGSIEVTKESVEGVKEIRQDLDTLLSKLTPEVTARLVKDRINPLDTDIKTLNDYLDGLRDEIEKESGEIKEAKKFSEFLYKADKEGRYTPEERDGLVSIYRLLNHINADDGRIIGELYREGRRVNLRNMLKAVRTNTKAGKINVSLDEKFGLAEEIIKDDDIEYNIESLMNNSIDADKIIDNKISYTKNVMRDVFENISAKGAGRILDDVNAGALQPEQLCDIMKGNGDGEAYDEYSRSRMDAASKVSDDTIRYLLDNDISVNADKILSYEYLISNLNIYKDLAGLGKKSIDGATDKMKERISGNADDNVYVSATDTVKEIVNDGLDDISDGINDILHEFVYEASYDGVDDETGDSLVNRRGSISADDIRSVMETGKAVFLMKKLSGRNEFFVPARVGDEEVTIHLKLKGGKENSRIRLSVHTEVYGDINADISVKVREERYVINGMLILQSEDIRDMLMPNDLNGEIGKNIENATTDIRVVCSDNYRDNDRGRNEPVEDAVLYTVSKELIRYICVKSRR